MASACPCYLLSATRSTIPACCVVNRRVRLAKWRWLRCGRSRYCVVLMGPITANVTCGILFSDLIEPFHRSHAYTGKHPVLENVRGAHIFKGGVNFRYGREIDERGSIGSLNSIPQVTFATGSNPVSTTQYKTPTSGINTSTDLPNLNSAINDLLGRVGQLQAGWHVAQPDLNAFKPAGTVNNMDTRTAGVRLLRAGYVEGSAEPGG